MKENFSERGQGLVEYSLILMLVAIVVIIALTALGTDINGLFGEVNSELESLTMRNHFV